LPTARARGVARAARRRGCDRLRGAWGGWRRGRSWRLRRRGRASGEPAPARAESAGCVITLAMSTPFLEPSDLPASSFSRELAGAEPGGIQTDGLAAG